MINCTEAKQLINPFIEGTAGLMNTAAFLRHIRQCPQCYEELEMGCIMKMAASDTPEEEEYDLNRLVAGLIRKRKKTLALTAILAACGILIVAASVVLFLLHLNGVI